MVLRMCGENASLTCDEMYFDEANVNLCGIK